MKLIYSQLIILFIIGSALLAQTNQDCFSCHNDNSLSTQRHGKQMSLFVDEQKFEKSIHQGLSCIDCHEGFKADEIPHSKKIKQVNCLTCHDDSPSKHVFHPQIAKSISSKEPLDISCSDCHGKHDIVSLKSEDSKQKESKAVKICIDCHSDIKEIFDTSEHGLALMQGVEAAPNCLTCHRNEISNAGGIRDSLENKKEQEKVCLSCHLDNPDVRARISPTAGFIAAYEKSVHGYALHNGNAKAANCVNCHGSHDIQKSFKSFSKVNKLNIAETCSKCHAEISKTYRESIHGISLLKGVKDSPTCTDCHGEHEILPHDDPRSRVAFKNVSVQVCSPCHSSLKLSEKYGIASGRIESYSDSYHGLAIRAGSVEVANCASCHGVHNIKPSSDSASTVNKKNLVETCGRCHPGANERFTIGSVHSIASNKEEPLLYWISTTYIILIITTIGGMFIHNFLDFIKKSKRKLLVRRGLITEEHYGTQLYLRMTLNERIQHAALFTSFITLVLTGFALRFPDAWWVVPIRNISPVIFDIRGIIHRVAATLMVLASLYHLYYILFTPRGKQLIKDLLPRRQDIIDLSNSIIYYLGISKSKPKFGRFSYIEKAEYWALVWGTIVMTITGIILWFDNTFLGILTKLGWDAARTIHYYEAWLATLAILVWHFYFVIFNPDVYPINLAFWKGTLTEEEMIEEHPLELEEIKRKELLSNISEDKKENQDKEQSNDEQ